MDHAGAGVERHVFTEIDRRQTIIERMFETDAFQRCALARSQRFSSQSVAREASFLQISRKDQQTLFGIDQVVNEFRMDVQRLVRRQRPRCRGPDHRKARLVGQCSQSEGLRHFIRFGKRERDIDGHVLAIFVLDLGLSQR